MFDVLPSSDTDSDITVEDIIIAGRMLESRGIAVGKLRLCGGEPLLHPRIKELYQITKEHWRPKSFFRCYSSGKEPLPIAKKSELHLSISPPSRKIVCHDPVLISPVDHGLPIVQGVDRQCKFARDCGCGFDTYGFTPCPRAWSLGRLFGMDVHRSEPTLLGWTGLCQHCLHSASNKDVQRLVNAAKRGEIEHPSPAFRAALLKRNAEGFLSITKFQKRLG